MSKRSGLRRSRPASGTEQASSGSLPETYASIATAARRPAAMASTTVAGPVWQSPPAKMPPLLVTRVRSSTAMVPQGVRVQVSPTVSPSTSWPMAKMMVSAGMVNSEPGTGSGRHLPLSSGSPSFIF